MAPPPTAQPFLSYTVLAYMGMRQRRWVLAVIVLALAIAAPPALAAFPGANGTLAVTPLTGNGIIVASPQTGRGRRVCDAPQKCGTRLSGARFAPSGREVVFTDSAGRLEIATPSGACVFCVASHPLSGTSPGFAPDGQTIIYVHRGLWQVTPGTTQPKRLLKAPVTAAVWSGSHQLLVTRRGWIWTGRPTTAGVLTLRRLVRGGAPAASPTGGELAYTRAGEVLTVRLSGHRRPTRIGRGSAPTFSPDGRELAYLNPRHQVTIRPLARGRTRTLTALHGRSLDWQPVTAVTRKGCAAGNGAVVATSGGATIRAAANVQQSHVVWNGCLTSIGVPFHLTGGSAGNGYDLSLGHVALAGDYAAMQFIYTTKYMDYTDTVNVYDLRNGTLVRSEPVSCQGMPCDVTSLTVNGAGFAAWHAYDTPHPAESQIASISCPSASLCVAADNAGDLLVSADPTGGRAAWTRVPLGVARSVSCPTVSYCVAVGGGGQVFTSTDPSGGPAAWQMTPANLGPLATVTALSCASPTLCVAIGGLTAYTTTDPTGAWHAAQVTSPGDLVTAVSCPSTTLCVLGTSTGEVLVSQDPADATPTWSAPAALPGADHDYITNLSCPSSGLCAAAAESPTGAAVLTTTDPAGGAGGWSAHPLAGASWVTCPTTALCVALAGGAVIAPTEPDVFTSTDPTDPSPSWSPAALPTPASLVTCATPSLCVAGAQQDVEVSTDPTGGTSAWTSFLADALSCDPATPCRAEVLQAVDDQGLHTLDTAPQGSGTVIADLQFSGDTLTWTNAGTPRSAGLS